MTKVAANLNLHFPPAGWSLGLSVVRFAALAPIRQNETMTDHAELLRFQSDILAGIAAAKLLLEKTPAGSDEHESTLESLNELRQALVRCEK
jgi:hypothetical protein